MGTKPKLLVFASGTETGGGSGFDQLVLNTQQALLNAEIVGVVSNHNHGGVRRYADQHRIPFFCFSSAWTAENYQWIVESFGAEWVALSGWLKLTSGLDPKRTFNIHPGPLPEFGGKGMFGRHVHEAVIAAFKRGEIRASAVSMHFVTDEYDRGPVFLEFPIAIGSTDTPKTLAMKVNKMEHVLQTYGTNLVVNGRIGWDGSDPKSLFYPSGYELSPSPH